MKKILCLSIALMLSGYAFADTGTAAGVVAATNADVNPFTGQSAAIEKTKSEVDLAKAQNSLLEEQAKKAKAEFMAKNADKLYSAELRKELAQASGVVGPAPVYGEPAGMPAAHKAPKKKHIEHHKIAKAAPPQVVMPVHYGPTLIGFIKRGDARIAMVESGGEVTYARTGESVPGIGTVEQITQDSAVIGGRIMHVEQAPLSNIDKQNIGPKLANGGGTGGIPPANMMPQLPGMPGFNSAPQGMAPASFSH